MPTVPLFNVAPPDADGSHEVTSPGGYEWWRFDAEDLAAEVRIVAKFLDGSPFHPAYLRAYARYVQSPTRNLPPVARDYACAYLAVYRRDRLAGQFMAWYPAAEVRSAVNRPDVRIGPNTMRRQADGSFEIALRGLSALKDQSADLRFEPTLRHPPMLRPFFSKKMTGADHGWVLGAPLCSVQGNIKLPGGSFNFTGNGYHDHNFGTAPVGHGLRRWVRGRALLADRMFTFHLACPTDRKQRDEVHLVQADSTGAHEQTVNHLSIDWDRLSGALLAYPSEIELNGFRLQNPRLVHSSLFYLRLIYDLTIDGQPVNQAFCEVAYPNRLGWPVLGRMIEMSIHRASGQGANNR